MAIENLFEKVSELAQTGVAKAKELADTGVAKSKELAEIGKLKMENVSEQEAIKKAYLEMGRLYYAEHGMEPEAPYAALCEKVTASKAKIEYNLERIADIKAAGEIEDEAFFTEPDLVPAEPVVEETPVIEEVPAEPGTPADDQSEA